MVKCRLYHSICTAAIPFERESGKVYVGGKMPPAGAIRTNKRLRENIIYSLETCNGMLVLLPIYRVCERYVRMILLRSEFLNNSNLVQTSLYCDQVGRQHHQSH